MAAEPTISPASERPRAGDHVRFDPALLFRPGRFDPIAVLAVFYVRRLFLPVLWLGLIVAIVADPNHVANVSLETPEDAWRALLSPLAGVVIAIALRLGANFAALLFAFPVSSNFVEVDRGKSGRGRASGGLIDRWSVASAVRSLRWTNDAREHAASRLEAGPRWAGVIDRGFLVANVVLPVATIVVAVIISD